MINNVNRNCGCGNSGVPARNNRNCRGGCGRDDRGCRELLNKLRAVDFSIVETVLYLDAYPHCAEAMQYYHKLMAERKQLVEAYETQCGPLTMCGNHGSTWSWTDGPWPWEADAN